MSLLSQAIQEYLTDSHPDWIVFEGETENSKTFIELYRENKYSQRIIISTTHQTITYRKDLRWDNTPQQTPYTDNTLIQQIEEIIKTQ